MEKIASEALAKLSEELKKYDQETQERRANIPDTEGGRHKFEEMENIRKQREAIEKHAANFTDKETAEALQKLREEVEQKTKETEARGWLFMSWGIYPTPETVEELGKLRAIYYGAANGAPLGEILQKLEETQRQAMERLQKTGHHRQAEELRRNGEEMAQLLKKHDKENPKN